MQIEANKLRPGMGIELEGGGFTKITSVGPANGFRVSCDGFPDRRGIWVDMNDDYVILHPNERIGVRA